MCWELRTSTIVMMTKLEERTRIKCDQYWPSRGSETYGPMGVTIADTQELATYCIRTFQLQRVRLRIRTKLNDGERRNSRRALKISGRLQRKEGGETVPVHGMAGPRRSGSPGPVPAVSPKSASHEPDRRRADGRPLQVRPRRHSLLGSLPEFHAWFSSAGVGRTGCFIVIDSMLERIRHEKTIDIYGHVTCLRAQRNYMVQTEDQYVFIHDALLEAVVCGNTEVPARNLHAHIQKLMQTELGDNITAMEIEFKVDARSGFCLLP